jgi:sugar lactone lactonase YvrE
LLGNTARFSWFSAAGFLLMQCRMRTEALVLLAGLSACATHGGMGDDDGTVDCGMKTAGVSTLAGAADSGFADGPGCQARFNNPVNVVYGPDGKLYVADFDGNKVRQVDPSNGNTTTIINQPNFSRPFGLAFLGNTLYVSTDNDPNSQHNDRSGTIWKVDIGGKSATPVAVDLGRPRELFAMKDGRLAVSDYQNHVIEIVDPASGMVTNLAGTFGTKGFADGAGAAAKFSTPYGIVQRHDGSLVVTDWDNQKLRVVTLDGAVTTMAGSTAGFADGSMSDAKFNHPQGLAIDANDNLYLTDIDNFRVRKISGSTITTIAGDGQDGFLDADDPLQAEFHGLEGLTVSPDGSKVYVADGTRGEAVPYNSVREIDVH